MAEKRRSIVYGKSDEEFIPLFKSSHTLTEFGYRIGLLNIGGETFWIMKRRIEELGLDSAKQFSGWRRADSQKISIPFAEYFAPHTKRAGHSLLKRILKDGLKENRCEECGNAGEWNGKPLALEVHHINGDHFDNRLANLKILCPNCHSQTGNNGAKNIQRGKIRKTVFLNNIILSFTNEPGVPAIKEKLVCRKCGKPITRWSKTGLCKECAEYLRRRVSHPGKEELLKLLEEYGFSGLANKLGIDASAIRKWCRTYGLPTRKKAVAASALLKAGELHPEG